MAVTLTSSSKEAFDRIISQLERVVGDTGKEVQAMAKRLVRVDMSPDADDIVLMSSIKLLHDGLYALVYVDGEAQKYCLVQEYGHPFYPNYGFTPYMRPAAQAYSDIFVDRVRRALQ